MQQCRQAAPGRKIPVMRESISIRKAEVGDYARITHLLRETGLPLDGLNGHENFLVLSRDGQIVGCAAMERYEKYGLLRSVALEPNERRQGFGRSVVQEVLQRARRDGIAEIVLFTTTAAPFFERLGFHAISRDEVPAPVRASVEFQSACPASAAVLRLVL
jgi:amino-acid N-acetyltransferase